MTSQLYGYHQPYSTMHALPASPYAAHPSPQQHSLPAHPLMMTTPHQTNPSQISHQPPQSPATGISNSSSMKMDPTPQQHNPSQRPILSPPHSAAAGTQAAGNNVPQTSPGGTSSGAAPGPIPATTPLVVRQDSNGVQWIAFEYSRDRVKMEYTIRCDVESVNVDNLSQQFKTENCVYPRACCSKDQYRGNRLVYETECNAVGWALAQLNPALRGKRGLIQRAVDSWRNSNQDPRLRSRRVRRMAKLNRRPTVQAQASPITPVTPGLPTAAGLGTQHSHIPPHRPGIAPLSMGPPQLHHHHAQPEANVGSEEVSGMFHPM